MGLVAGFLTLFVLWRALPARRRPVFRAFQAAVEIRSKWWINRAKANIHNAESRKFIAPLGLTVFVWIF